MMLSAARLSSCQETVGCFCPFSFSLDSCADIVFAVVVVVADAGGDGEGEADEGDWYS